MRDYINFINKYSKKFDFIIDYNTYLEVKNCLSKSINDILNFNGMDFENVAALIDFTMCYLLKTHSAKAILESDLNEEIETIIDRVFTYQQDKVYFKEEKEEPEEDEVKREKRAFNYIYNDFKNIKFIFEKDFDIKKLADIVKDSLLFDGRTCEQIINGECDSEILTYLSKGYFDVEFSEEFKKMREVVELNVSHIFNSKKRDLRYYTNQDNFEYLYYNDVNNLNKDAFAISVSLLEKNVSPGSVTIDDKALNEMYNYIQRDMIRINSTRVKPDNMINRWKKMSREEKMDKLEKTKRAAIIFAIIFGLVAAENMIYNSIHKNKEKSYKPKYKTENTGYKIDNVNIDKLMGKYDYDENEFAIDNLDQEIEGENIARL